MELETKLSLIGLEGFVEGPIGDKVSFLANGRYSTFALIEKMGMNTKGVNTPEFHDINYKLHFDITPKAKLNLFGINGWSQVEEELTGEDTLGNEIVKRRDKVACDHVLNGVNYQQLINPRTSLNLAAAVLKSRSHRLDRYRNEKVDFEILEDQDYKNLFIKAHASIIISGAM
ncbi:MAG: hypothetical protein GY751_21320 [Bacteroidetes bacterium]|nr:hypothetical protein [Bacteroidota bacterium]